MRSNDIDLKVMIGNITLNNPITTASGTFSAKDSTEYYDINELGAVITKGVSSKPWDGNPTPRVAETYGGMLNSIGLQNSGVDEFIKQELAYLKKFNTKIIANVAGKTLEEYCHVLEKLNETCIDMVEINISCPNIKAGGISFGTDPSMAGAVTQEAKRRSIKPVIVKLTPNVTDIAEIAKAVEANGADAVSLINTVLGMRIDVHKRQPVLKNIFGGLSGPAIKPIAVRMVYQVRRAIKLPIIGLGGIMTGEDAVEFILAGADAVSIGTAALIDPAAPVRIKKELMDYMRYYGYKNLRQIREGAGYEL